MAPCKEQNQMGFRETKETKLYLLKMIMEVLGPGPEHTALEGVRVVI